MAEPLRPVTDDDAEPMSVGEALGATGDAIAEAAKVIAAARSMSAQISEIGGRARGFVVTPLAALAIVFGGLLVLAAAVGVVGWAYADRAGLEAEIRHEREEREAKITELAERVADESTARANLERALGSRMDELERGAVARHLEIVGKLGRIEGQLEGPRGRK